MPVIFASFVEDPCKCWAVINDLPLTSVKDTSRTVEEDCAAGHLPSIVGKHTKSILLRTSPCWLTTSHFFHVTTDEVYLRIASISAKSSPIDFVSMSVVRAFFDCSSRSLPKLQASFSDGCPTKLKSAMVEPLLKMEGLDKDAQCNYWPISNSCTLSKVFKRLVLVWLRQHANMKCLVTESHHHWISNIIM